MQRDCCRGPPALERPGIRPPKPLILLHRHHRSHGTAFPGHAHGRTLRGVQQVAEAVPGVSGGDFLHVAKKAKMAAFLNRSLSDMHPAAEVTAGGVAPMERDVSVPIGDTMGGSLPRLGPRRRRALAAEGAPWRNRDFGWGWC